MRRLFLRRSLTILLPFLALGAACREQPPNLHATGEVIVCLGDSLTAGSGAGRAPGYPEILATELGVPVVNAGVPGDTVEMALARLDDVLDRQPWLVIVELGGNDVLRQVPAPRTEEAARELLTRLVEARVAVLVIEVHGPIGGDRWRRIESVARELDIPVLEEVLPELLTDPRYKSDQVHLNSEGYRRLALAVAERVAPWLAMRRAA